MPPTEPPAENLSTAEARPWPRRCAALAILALALAGCAFTLATWRADAAERRGDFAAAVRWRPGIALYHRQWGESLILSDPAAADDQLRLALRFNPFDAVAMSDLTLAELASGRWTQAVSQVTMDRSRDPGFDRHWRLANLYLSHADLEGFWSQTALAAGLAGGADFDSILSRALTASNYDFPRLRAALPPRSPPAAISFLLAAVARRDPVAARAGSDWLLSLPPAPASDALRREALRQYLLAAFQFWPAEAGAIWRRGWRAGWLPGPIKAPDAPLLLNADFDPVRAALARRIVPDADSPDSAVFDWRLPHSNSVGASFLLTGDAAHPSAAEFDFDGTEPDDLELAQQLVLVSGAPALLAGATARQLDPGSLGGLSLRLADAQGRMLGDLALPLAGAWSSASGAFPLPARAAAVYRLSLHYRRPQGQIPLRNRILVADVRLRVP